MITRRKLMGVLALIPWVGPMVLAKVNKPTIWFDPSQVRVTIAGHECVGFGAGDVVMISQRYPTPKEREAEQKEMEEALEKFKRIFPPIHIDSDGNVVLTKPAEVV